MVFSRPIRSETHPKNGRVAPFVIAVDRERQGQQGQPAHQDVRPCRSRAVKAPICEVTIRPLVDIMVIVRKGSQNTGVRSMRAGRHDVGRLGRVRLPSPT